MRDDVRVGIVGATGAAGSVLRELFASHPSTRYFASARSAGAELDGRRVEEATPGALAAGGIDVCFFAVGAAESRELVPAAVAGGAVAIDKSSAFRLEPDVPLVIPEVNGERAFGHQGVVAVPNCSTIQLACVLKPLDDAAGIARVRLATYQSASGAGVDAMERLRGQTTEETNVGMDWPFDGEEFEEESKLRAETRRLFERPELPISANCVRVPVMVAHAQAVWVETEEPLEPERARAVLDTAPSVRVHELATPRDAAGGDEVLVSRIRRDETGENGLVLFTACDNLRKGAALNALQIAELLLERRAVAV